MTTPPLKLGDRVRPMRRRVVHDRLGTVVGSELLAHVGYTFQVQWDDEDDPEGPYAAEDLDRVNDLFAAQDRAVREGRAINRVVVHAGDGRVALVLNGEDIAPRVSRYTFSGPDKDGQWYLHATFPIDVPPNGDK